MITLHHLGNSRSQRVVWFLEELGLPYELVRHERGHRSEPVKSLLAVHPLGKAPVLCDGSVTLAETGAIFDYLNETYGNGRFEPARGTEARIRFLYWKAFAEGSFMPYLAMKLVFANLVTEAPFLARPLLRFIARAVGTRYLNPNILRELACIEAHLSQHTWLAGQDFSAADALMGFMLEAVAGRMAPAASFPHLNAYVARLRERPAYRRAMEKGGWSVADHDRYWSSLSA